MTSLGAVSIPIGLSLAVTMSGFGTLAHPLVLTDTATVALDFSNARFVATDPVAATGPTDSYLPTPSIWYEFTASQTASWLASTSGFPSGATIELYTGPEDATADDLVFVATNGAQGYYLGPVTIDVSALLGSLTPRIESVSLGVVAMTGVVTVGGVLT